MDNTLYYTLSTIPQVIAALIALTGVFIALRVEALHKRIMGFGYRVLDTWESMEKDMSKHPVYMSIYSGPKGQQRLNRLSGSIRTDHEDYLIEQIEDAAKIEKDQVGHRISTIPEKGFNNLLDRIKSIKEQKKELVKSVKRLFIISGIGILTPLICLPFVHLICCSGVMSYSILLINLIVGVIVIFRITKMIVGSIEFQ